MNQERAFYNQPIRSLQTMLRAIAMFSDQYQRLIPDGIYGPETQSAVSTFQRNRSLPVTGITNQQTWDELVRMYDNAVDELSPAQPIENGDDSEFPFTRGDVSTMLKIAQCMLCEIAHRHSCVCPPELTGRMDEMMVNSVMEFQRLNGLPATGKLDKTTWKNLALQFSASERMNRKP